jgi:hypothetical protein
MSLTNPRMKRQTSGRIPVSTGKSPSKEKSSVTDMDNIAAYAIHRLYPCKDFLCSVKLPNRKESLRNCKDDYIDGDTDKDSHGDVVAIPRTRIKTCQ